MIPRPDRYDGTTESVRDAFGDLAVARMDKNLWISSKVVRLPKFRAVFVGKDQNEDTQLDAFIDALHWHTQTDNPQQLPLSFVFSADGENAAAVRDGLAILRDSLSADYRSQLDILQDFDPISLPLPDLTTVVAERCEQLNVREQAILPGLGREIAKSFCRTEFRWYRTVTSTYWSGRIAGLQVCKLHDTGELIFGVGKIGGEARDTFMEIMGDNPLEYDAGDLNRVVVLIEQLGKERVPPDGKLSGLEPEHRMQARILNDELPVIVDGQQLENVISPEEYPFEFPAQWSENQASKYIDVLCRAGKQPWALELKRPQGQGQYYRHGITQAILYRHFIRSWGKLNDWFENRGLDASRCEAALVIPRIAGEKEETLRKHLQDVARLFDIRIVELPQ